MSYILIVEENCNAVARLAGRLKHIGHEVEVVANTEAMWTALYRHPVDMIIMNLQEEASIQVVALMRQHFPGVGLLMHRVSCTPDCHVQGLQFETGKQAAACANLSGMVADVVSQCVPPEQIVTRVPAVLRRNARAMTNRRPRT